MPVPVVYYTGSLKFAARALGPSPLMLPYELDPNTAYPLKKGTPVAYSGAGSNLIRLPATTSGYISAAKILGFSNVDQALGVTQRQGIEFAVMPIIYRNNHEVIQVFVADTRTIYTMATTSGTTSALSYVGQTISLKHDTTKNQWTLDPTNLVWPMATVVGVVPGDESVEGGRLDFIIAPTRSQYLTGI